MTKQDFDRYLDYLTSETGYDFNKVQKAFAYQAAKKYHEQALRKHDAVERSEQCCSPTDGFYLGTTCPHCNKPFRKDIK